MSDLLVSFARTLRARGVPIGTGAIADFVQGAEAAGDAYWAGRSTLLSRPEHIAIYDQAFAEFFAGAAAVKLPPERGAEVDVSLRRGEAGSGVEMFGRLNARGPLAGEIGLGVDPPLRRTRRRKRSRHGDPDLRRTLRLALRSDGEPLRLARRTRRRQPRRIVLLLDVSGSMSSYARRLVILAHSAIHEHRRWEVFCFATRLTRLTHVLADTDPQSALSRASGAVVDWEGGTKIGDAIKTFLDEYGHAGMARGAVVVICSDGFDVGEPEVLGEQMARLARLANRVIWVNPLLEFASYEPRSAAMRAALPHVDVFSDLARG